MIKLTLKYLYLLVALIATGILYFFTMTTSGLQLILACIALTLPGKITIEQINGTLFSDISLKSITYQDKDEIIHSHFLAITWNPKGLLQGQVIIKKMSLGTTQIKILPSPSSHSSFDISQIIWPGYLKVEQLEVEKIDIQVIHSNIHLSGSVNHHWNIHWDIKIARLDDIFPELTGSFYSTGIISGPLLSPEIFSNIDINHFNYDDNKVDTLHGKMQLSFRPHTKSTFSMTASNLSLSDYSFKKINMNASGDFIYTNNRVKTNAQIEVSPIEIPQLGVTLDKIRLQSITESNKPWVLSGELYSGNGKAQVKSIVDFSKSNYPTTVSLQGQDILISNLDNYKIVASPDLTLSFNNPKIELRGLITIPEARIISSNFGNSLSMPDELVYEDKLKLPVVNPLSNLTMKVNVILGEKIHLQHDDLEAELSGKLLITQESGQPLLATGELYAIKGNYRAYGQTLTIQQGRLIYTSNLLFNPGLNIRAGRDIKTIAVSNNASSFSNSSIAQPIYTGSETVTVGVQIQGTADNPMTSLYSTPAMNQKDILSYLLFGFPQSQATTASQLSTLLSATAALNSKGKLPSINSLTHGLQEKLGLSELSVGATEIFDPNKGAAVATTSVMVGKQLAPNLYMHYSVSLFNPVSILNVRYQLSKRWAIQSETSRIDSGADLLYGIERD